MTLLYRFVCASARLCFTFLYHNKLELPPSVYRGRAILAPNHASYFDPPIIAAFWPGEVHFLASDYLFKVPFLGWIIRRLNSHPVRRGAADLTSIRKVLEILEKDQQIVIFPEGRRSEDGRIHPFKEGIASIAFRADAAIIPVHIEGTFAIWPPSRKFPRLRGKTRIVFGEPIFPSAITGEKHARVQILTHKLQAAVEQLAGNSRCPRESG